MGAGREPVAAMNGLHVDIRAKTFGAAPVLGPMTFDVPAGQRVALLGPSGIGKSTLLAVIAGTDAAFDGAVLRPPGRLAVVFQTPRLLPWRTLAENIAIIPGSGGMERARDLLASVGLADAADQHPEKVSLGMQRRAALARALAVRPGMILMDEPLVSLDPATADEMQRHLSDAMDQTGATALFATHDRREALALADRVLELDGRPAILNRDRTVPLKRAQRTPEAMEELLGDWFNG